MLQGQVTTKARENIKEKQKEADLSAVFVKMLHPMSVLPATKILRGEGVDLEARAHNIEATVATEANQIFHPAAPGSCESNNDGHSLHSHDTGVDVGRTRRETSSQLKATTRCKSG